MKGQKDNDECGMMKGRLAGFLCIEVYSGGKRKECGLMSESEKHPQDIYERTKAFALRIIKLYSALPKTAEARILGKEEEISQDYAIRVLTEMGRA